MTVKAEPDHHLRGRSLAMARAAWIVLALIMCGIVLANLLPYIRFQLTVCETCRITPTYAIILQASGVDPTRLAVFIIIPAIIVFIGWMGMRAAIFFLKSNDRRALLLSALLVIILSTLLIAALFTSLRNRLQLLIDRRFFRIKYDAQQVLAQFAQITCDEVDMDNLTRALIDVANETMQPKQVGLWLKLKK